MSSPNGAGEVHHASEFEAVVEVGGEGFGFVATHFVRRELGSAAANGAEVKKATNGEAAIKMFPNLEPWLAKIYYDLHKREGLIK